MFSGDSTRQAEQQGQQQNGQQRVHWQGELQHGQQHEKPWLRPSDAALMKTREARAAQRHATVDAMAHDHHTRLVHSYFGKWWEETAAVLRLDSLTFQLHGRLGRPRRHRRLAASWRTWQGRRHMLHFQAKHEKWLRSFLSSHRVVRIFARPYLSRSWERWRAHTSSRSSRHLHRCLWSRGLQGFAAERAEARRTAKRTAIVAALQFAAIQYLQLQSCCKAWASWLAWYDRELLAQCPPCSRPF